MEHKLSGTISIERDICKMLESLELSTSKVPENEAHDVSMFEGPSYPLLTTPTPSNINVDYYGCEYLKTIGRQLDNYATTGGEYLEAIFTHREILASYPSAHHECARGFTDIARMLEQRAWRADREADMEAVTAFRYEAWCIASTLSSRSPQGVSSDRRQAHPCMMPMM